MVDHLNNTDAPLNNPFPNNPLLRRLVHGLGAQIYFKVVQTIIRLAEVPLLLTFWDAQLYGEWLMLSAIPAYLSMADGGFATAACRDMTIRAGAGDRDGVQSVFQSTWTLLILLAGTLLLLSFAFVQFAPIADWLKFERIAASELKIVLFLLIVYVLIGFQGGLLNGGFWVAGRYPLGMVLMATTHLLELGGLAIAVVFGGGPAQAALGYLGGRLLGILIVWIGQQRVSPWLCLGFRHASLREIRRLTVPALASLAFPLGNAFNIQGMRLVVGLTLGPLAVAIFTPLRTLSQLAAQPQAIVNGLIEPELALTYGSGKMDAFRKIFLRSSQLAFWSCLAASLFLVSISGVILPIWTGGKIAMNWPLFILLLAAVIVNSVWYIALMVPYATNLHSRAAVVFLLIYGMFTFGFAAVTTKIFGLPGTGLAILLAEILMSIFILQEALRLSVVRFYQWFMYLARPPIETLNKVLLPVIMKKTQKH